jgi:hypothetical protein
MESEVRAIPGVEAAGCPLLHQVDARWRYHGLGCCTGLPHGLPMIPTVAEYRSRCCTPAYVLCPVYHSRAGQESLGPWLQAEYGLWALRPLDGPCGGAPAAAAKVPVRP